MTFRGALIVCGVTFALSSPASAKAIRWHGCGGDAPAALQCGEIAVPLDYAKPAGAKIRLGFARLRASDRARRVGSLIVNPGGPGGAGSDVIAPEAAGKHLWHPALRRRFDLIGMDPRGIGMSTPVLCEPDTFNAPAPFVPRTPEEFAQLQSYADGLGAGCLRQTGPLLGHVDTLSVARDMEALRAALGDGKLNFLGLSYGAEIGTLYAERYPTHIRAMALDGILDHSASTTTIFRDAAEAYEDSFDRFAAWCRGAAQCAWHGRDVGAAFDALVTRADREPIPASVCATNACRTATVTGGDIRLNALQGLLTRKPIPLIGTPGWAALGDALAAAEHGDASAFATPQATEQRSDPFASLAVNCVDFARPVNSYDEFASLAALGRRVAPHTQGASEAWLATLACMRWPVPQANPQHIPHIRGKPRILLVSATHDPSTSYVWARRVARQIPQAVLLTREGDGHTSSWLGPSSRTNSAIARYLITRRPPPRGTRYGS